MDFRRTKFFLALGLMGIGLIIALVWHAWQGWGLHRGYPYNTFLYTSLHRFGDLTQIVDYASLPSPYQSIWGGYLPTSYNFAALFLLFPIRTGTLIYLAIGALGLWGCVLSALRPIFFQRQQALLSGWSTIALGTALTWISYPLLISMDRANIELIMGLLVALAMLCFRKQRHDLGLISLFPAICFKLYPCLLLLLFLRPGYLLKVGALGLLVGVASFTSFACCAGSLEDNWHLWHRNLHFMNNYYIIGDGQLHGSASLWNTAKAILESFAYLQEGRPLGIHIMLAKEFAERFYTIYSYLFLALSIVVAAYTLLIETEFFRRAMALLILMTLCVPSGGDYRLLYAEIALVILICLPTRRRHDLWVVGLLAFALVPKKEIIFGFLGLCDTGMADTPLGVFLNPPCLLAALILLVRDGCQASSFRFWPQKILRLVRAPWHSLARGRA